MLAKDVSFHHFLSGQPNAALAIIGSGSLQQQLTDYIRTKHYADRVLLCGDVDHADTLCAIRDCDIFLRTTLYDGDAVSVREALHLGKPVIASDNANMQAVLELYRQLLSASR